MGTENWESLRKQMYDEVASVNGRINLLESAVNELKVICSELNVNVGHFIEKLSTNERRQEDMDLSLRGNGQPGLLARVAVSESRIKLIGGSMGLFVIGIIGAYFKFKT